MVYQATRVIQQALLERDIKCDVVERGENSAVVSNFDMKSGAVVSIHFISADENNDVAIRVFDFVRVAEDQRETVLTTVNQLNKQFRFAKFVLEENGGVNVEFDCPMKSENLGEMAFEVLVRLVSIMDDAYPILMKALWA